MQRHEASTRPRNIPSLFAILLANGVLVISQVNIASVYLPISVTFDEAIVGLGILTSLFYIGCGIVEIPASILGARMGPKRLAMVGLVVSFVSLAISGFAPNFDSLIVLRFTAGVGQGLLFPSAVVLAVRTMGERSSGLGAGLVNVSFAVGAGLGVFGWSVLSALYGWRASLLIEAAITLGVVATFFTLVPSDDPPSGFRLSGSSIKAVFTNRKLVAISMVLFGAGESSSLSGSFLVYYLEVVFKSQPGFAGLIGAIGYVTLFFTAILGGRLFDKGVNPKVIVFGSMLLLTFGTCFIAVHSIFAAIVGTLICGMAVGPISTVSFVVARRTSPARELEPLVVGIVDNFSLLGVFTGALVFPFLVIALGYPSAWVIGGLLGLVLAIPVLFIKKL